MVSDNKLSPYAAQRQFNIPRMTIVNRLNEKSKSSIRGRPEEEKIIVDHLIVLSKMGFGLDKLQLQMLIKSFVFKFDKVTPFKDNKPGEDWINGYTIL